MAMDDRPIIIIRKKSGEHAAHHGGAWKVAYADFVTAMMAFFLVMWILGLNSDTRKAIASYFNDPTGFMKTVGGGRFPMATGREMSQGNPTIMATSGSPVANKGDSERLRAAKSEIERMLAGRSEFRNLREHVEVEMTEEGLRIELLEDGRRPLFFTTGSSTLQPSAQQLLGMIGRQLRALPNDITLEGHTDARPYAGGLQGYSNWDLSSDRANAARRVLQGCLREYQIASVGGFADRNLRRPDDPLHYSNRRVTILVRSMFARTRNTIEHDPARPESIDLLAPPASAR